MEVFLDVSKGCHGSASFSETVLIVWQQERCNIYNGAQIMHECSVRQLFLYWALQAQRKDYAIEKIRRILSFVPEEDRLNK